MVELVGMEDPDVRDWFAPVTGPRGQDTAVAFRDGDGVIGGWIFERYTGFGGSVHAHWRGRGPGWLKPYMLQMAVIYCFGQLGVDRIYGEVPASMADVRDIDERLGFREVALLRGYFPDDDLVIYEMTKQECRWLPSDYKEAQDGR